LSRQKGAQRILGTAVAEASARSNTVTRRLIALTVFITAIMTVGSQQPGHAKEVVEILLRGHYFVEPATVQITVAVEPDASNRSLRIEADGERMFRASQLTLEGASEKKMHSVEFKNLPAGNYILRAEVLGESDVRGMAEQEMVVSGAGMR
jgi:hypothetical protein